jgi:hypothetical protein
MILEDKNTNITIDKFIGSPYKLVILKPSFSDCPLSSNVLSVSMHLIKFPVTFVTALIAPQIASFAVPCSLVKVPLVVVAVSKFILAFSMLVVVLPKSAVHIALGNLDNPSTLFHIILPFAFVNVAVRIIVLPNSIFLTSTKISCV